jgi:hypothetical protein
MVLLFRTLTARLDAIGRAEGGIQQRDRDDIAAVTGWTAWRSI